MSSKFKVAQISLDGAVNIIFAALLTPLFVTLVTNMGYTEVSLGVYWGTILTFRFKFLWDRYWPYINNIYPPWNWGTPWAALVQLLDRDDRHPHFPDFFFPWWKWLWKPNLERMESCGCRVIVQDWGRMGPGKCIELSPRLWHPAIDVLERVRGLGGFLCIDSDHASRPPIGYDESEANYLGDWRVWIPILVESGLVQVFDLNLNANKKLLDNTEVNELEAFLNGEPTESLEMLLLALKHGFKGTIRVQFRTRYLDHLFKWQSISKDILSVLMQHVVAIG